MRLFIAVELSAHPREQLARALSPLREHPAARGVRFVPPQSWHFTLRFIGDAEEGAAGALGEACRAAARDGTPFALRLGGLGAFPTVKRARVLWVGVADGAPALGALAQRVREQVDFLGYPPEARPFAPHLTVGRLRRPRDLGPLLAAAPALSIEAPVEGITLFRSHLSSQGARYEALRRCLLGGT